MNQLEQRVHHNVAVVATANKLARIAWAVLAKDASYHWPAAASIATSVPRPASLISGRAT